ncbi:hypothetical protein FRC02_002683 [Tulasnella sp. 418]|nr:hypothetical protein FRC02_002683 [Tulasnella sp. 418]
MFFASSTRQPLNRGEGFDRRFFSVLAIVVTVRGWLPFDIFAAIKYTARSIHDLYRPGQAAPEDHPLPIRSTAPVQAPAQNIQRPSRDEDLPRAPPGTPVEGSSQASLQDSLVDSPTPTVVDPSASGSTVVLQEPPVIPHTRNPVGQVPLPAPQRAFWSNLFSSRWLNII